MLNDGGRFWPDRAPQTLPLRRGQGTQYERRYLTGKLLLLGRKLPIGKRLTEIGYYDKAVYHFQQSIEKSIKSVLIAMGVFQKTHLIGAILRKVITERDDIPKWKKELIEIAEISESIEPEMSLSRYPGIIRDSLWLPFEEYSKEDADGAMAKAEKTLSIAVIFVEDWFSATP